MIIVANSSWNQWKKNLCLASCNCYSDILSILSVRVATNIPAFRVWDLKKIYHFGFEITYVLLSKSCTLWRQGKEFFLTLNFEVKYVRNTVSILFQIFLEDSQSQLGLNWSYLNIFSQSLEVIFPTYSWDGDENKGKVFHHLLLSLTMIPHIP